MTNENHNITIVQLYDKNEKRMKIVVDTSVIIAVVTNEPHKHLLVSLTKGCDLVAPSSVHWEVGNAFSAMLRRNRITLNAVHFALRSYREIPIRFFEVDMDTAMNLCDMYRLYAYDAYVVECAVTFKAPLLTLDTELATTAKDAGVKVMETDL